MHHFEYISVLHSFIQMTIAHIKEGHELILQEMTSEDTWKTAARADIESVLRENAKFLTHIPRISQKELL